MEAYFKLQYRRINRKLIAFGLPVWLAYILIPLIAFYSFNWLYQQVDWAAYVLVGFALALMFQFSDKTRNDFLRTIFSPSQYTRLRLLENGCVALPFLFFLLYKQSWLESLVLLIVTVVLSLINFKIKASYVWPTPFGRRPYEFVVGFRKNIYVYSIAYALAAIAVVVANFNLGVFALIVMTLASVSFYTKVENELWVWNYSLSAAEFLNYKLRSAAINFGVSSLPIVIVLMSFFYTEIEVVILFVLLCLLYIMAMVLAKYAAFPRQVDVAEGIYMAICFMFPPLLLVCIPLFYRKAIKKLNPLLS